MPSSQSPNVGLNHSWDLGESGWNLQMDENLRAVDALLFLTVASMTASIPGSPAAGDRYIVPAGATGAWTGHGGKVARFDGTAWEFYTPKNGWIAYVTDIAVHKKYNGTSWAGSVSTTTAENRGGAVNVFLQKVGAVLRFRTLEAGDNVAFDTTTNPDVIKINASASGGSGGIPEAPNDAFAYVRKALGWARGIAQGGDTLLNVRETVQSVTTGSVDANLGAIANMTLSANATLNVTNLDSGQSLLLIIKNGDTYTMNWTTNHTITWIGGGVPTLAAETHIELLQNGATLYGYNAGDV